MILFIWQFYEIFVIVFEILGQSEARAKRKHFQHQPHTVVCLIISKIKISFLWCLKTKCNHLNWPPLDHHWATTDVSISLFMFLKVLMIDLRVTNSLLKVILALIVSAFVVRGTRAELNQILMQNREFW